MQVEQRRNARFADIGRVEAPEICVFPGILVDISRTGFRVRFSAVVELDMDAEYEFKVKLTRKNFIQEFILIGSPRWIKHTHDSTEAGFYMLHSPKMHQFMQYIQTLENAEAEKTADERMLQSICLFA